MDEAQKDARRLVLDTANRVALDILASRTGAEALRHIVEAARILSGARYAALGVARADGKGLSDFLTVGLTPEQEAKIGSLPRGAGVLGLLLERAEPLRLDDLKEHSQAVGFPPHHPPMKAFLGVPIRRGQTTLGSLYLTDKQGGASFTEADELAVGALGAHAAVAIHNLQMLARQRALTSSLITAQEEERRAVAYDLHDGLTQYVMAAHAHLDTFRRRFDGTDEKANRDLEQGLKYLKQAVIESRRMINGLRSLSLDDLGLAGALEELMEAEKAAAGWEIADLSHNIPQRRFEKTLETGVYRVAQEFLTNARKHAQTSRVELNLREVAATAQLKLEARDWGRGFDVEARLDAEGHVGLQGMAERVSLLGGAFQIESASGQGTIIRATFPLLAATKYHF